MDNFKIITWDEFVEKFSNSFEMPFEDFGEDLGPIRLYTADENGNIHFDGDFIMECEDYNVVIDGNLIVNGNIEMAVEDGCGNFLFINGAVTANAILLSGFPSMEVKKDAVIKNGIIGMYGDDGGYLHIDGEVTTKVVLNCDYFNMRFNSAVNAVVIDTSYGELESDYDAETISEAIMAELFNGEEFLVQKAYEYLKKGQNVLKQSLESNQFEAMKFTRDDKDKFTLISVDEALSSFPLLKETINAYGDDDSKIMLYEGETYIKGDLDLDDYFDEIAGIICNGNMYIEGCLRNLEGDFGPFLLVIGDLYSQNIDQGGSEFYITGNANVENVIYGYYNHGMLTIKGSVKAKFIIEDDHFFDFGNIDKTCTTINNYSDCGDFDYYLDDLPRVFVSEVLKNSESIDSEQFIKRLNEGKRVLIPGSKPSRMLVEDYIAEQVQSGGDLFEVKLEDRKLKQFPRMLLKLKSLKVLNLSSNPMERIPEDLNELINLEELYISDCNLSELPKSIGDMHNLKILDVSNNRKEFRLADEIGNLGSLRSLDISYTNFDLPQSISKLKNLEELNCGHCCDEKPTDFPEIICELEGLKKLNLSDNSLKTIPDSIVKLQNLEELNIDTSLCYLETIPDLANLKKLKIIHADGLKSYVTRPCPYQSLIKSFFTVTSLEELYIDRHGKNEEFYEEGQLEEVKNNLTHNGQRFETIKNKLKPEGDGCWKGVVRENLKPQDLLGISNLRNLKVLDLSFNGLSGVPDEFYLLKNLENINLEYNSLNKDERTRLINTFPNCKINLRKQDTDENSKDNPDLRKLLNLVTKGNKQRDNGNYTEAVIFYDKALKYINDGIVESDYNLLYLHYAKMWVYSRISYSGQLDGQTTEEYKKLCFDEAQICLELVPENFNIWQFTDEGQFHEEVIRYACNSVSWYLYERNTDTAILEEALEYANRGCAFAREVQYYYIIDTKVRILLKLGRKDDAFQIVRSTLSKCPGFIDFQDFLNNQEYLDWVKSKFL